MSSERGERMVSKVAGATTIMKPTTEPEQLPCPRCDSTNTKFCYYNNYNLSQPRHFCKGCRRYWTRGGTLRNVPIGGGTRRSSSSSNKRPRTDSSTNTISTSAAASAAHQEVLNSVPVSEMGSVHHHFGGHFSDMNLNEALPENGGFSSLLNSDMHAAAGNVFLGVPGRFSGVGSGFYGMGFGLNMFDFPMEPVRDGGSVVFPGGGNTWQLMSGVEGGSLNDGNDNSFGWPDLAISTQGKSLK